jgi:two-component system cell cycle sensor histidine kinase/response regulator CckA
MSDPKSVLSDAPESPGDDQAGAPDGASPGETPMTPPSSQGRSKDLRRGNGEHILLVDDEDTVRRVTGRLLEKLGYEVTTAADGAEALDLLESAGPFDLVLTDVVMPGMTGIEMADQIREIRPAQRILFTSGYTTREYGRAPGQPPRPFMPKPFSMADLAENVRRVLDS